MECVAHIKRMHQKRTQGKIRREPKERTIPFFIGDINLFEHQQRHNKQRRKAMMQQPRDGRNIEKRNILI